MSQSQSRAVPSTLAQRFVYLLLLTLAFALISAIAYAAGFMVVPFGLGIAWLRLAWRAVFPR